MEHAEHISKLHPALDSGERKSGSREVQVYGLPEVEAATGMGQPEILKTL